MEKGSFEMVKTWVCAYFLILYSCLQILQKLWHLSARDSFAEYLIPFFTPVLLLSAGIYLSVLFKKKLPAFPDDEKSPILAAARFIGGCVILAFIFTYLVPYCLLGVLSGKDDLKAFLFPLGFYVPFLITAAVAIKRGSLKNERPSSAESIAFLNLRIALMLICIISAYQMLAWFVPFITMSPHEFNPVLLKWIITESAFSAVALILLFVPLRLKINLKDKDSRRYNLLSRQSYTLIGWVILIGGISRIGDAVIRKYDSFDLFFFELNEFLLGLLPALLLILVSLILIYFGRVREFKEL